MGLTYVNAARAGKPKHCKRCGTKINLGESYWWISHRLGKMSIRHNWCQLHHPRPSELTMSDKLSNLYAARESVEDVSWDAETPLETYKDDLESALNDAAQVARETGDEYREAKENMPESLQESDTAQLCDERADACDAWADELEQAAQEVANYEPDEPPEGEELDVNAELEKIQEFATSALDALEL